MGNANCLAYTDCLKVNPEQPAPPTTGTQSGAGPSNLPPTPQHSAHDEQPFSPDPRQDEEIQRFQAFNLETLSEGNRLLKHHRDPEIKKLIVSDVRRQRLIYRVRDSKAIELCSLDGNELTPAQGDAPNAILAAIVPKKWPPTDVVFEEWVEEMRSVVRLNHPNLVKHLRYYREGEILLAVSEWAANGDVMAYIKKCGPGGKETLTWEQRLKILRLVANGLDALHSLPKPVGFRMQFEASNVLLGQVGIFWERSLPQLRSVHRLGRVLIRYHPKNTVLWP